MQRPHDVPLAGTRLVGGGVEVDVLPVGAFGVQPVAGREEQVSIRLLNGDGQFLLGTRFKLPHLTLLMLRQKPFGNSERLSMELLQRTLRIAWFKGVSRTDWERGRPERTHPILAALMREFPCLISLAFPPLSRMFAGI